MHKRNQIDMSLHCRSDNQQDCLAMPWLKYFCLDWSLLWAKAAFETFRVSGPDPAPARSQWVSWPLCMWNLKQCLLLFFKISCSCWRIMRESVFARAKIHELLFKSEWLSLSYLLWIISWWKSKFQRSSYSNLQFPLYLSGKAKFDGLYPPFLKSVVSHCLWGGQCQGHLCCWTVLMSGAWLSEESQKNMQHLM